MPSEKFNAPSNSGAITILPVLLMYPNLPFLLTTARPSIKQPNSVKVEGSKSLDSPENDSYCGLLKLLLTQG